MSNIVAGTGRRPTFEVGEIIRSGRHARRMTQRELAGDAFSLSYISGVERGKIQPSLKALGILADRLHLAVADLILLPEASDGARAAERSGKQATAASDDIADGLVEARVLLHLGRCSEAMARLDTLRELATTRQSRARCDLSRAVCQLASGESVSALRTAREALIDLHGDTSLAGELHLVCAKVFAALCLPEAALEECGAILRAGLPAGAADPAVVVDALLLASSLHEQRGDLNATLETLREACAVGGQLERPERAAARYASASAAAAESGELFASDGFAIRAIASWERERCERLSSEAARRLEHAESLQHRPVAQHAGATGRD